MYRLRRCRVVPLGVRFNPELLRAYPVLRELELRAVREQDADVHYAKVFD